MSSILNRLLFGTPAKRPRFHWSVAVTTAPGILPVTVAEQKAWSRIDRADEDALITSCITAAVDMAERRMWRKCIEQVLVLSMDEWAADVIRLPWSPASLLVAVREIADDGTPTSLDLTNFLLDGNASPSRLILINGNVPVGDRLYRGVEVEYKVGYGATAAAVPTNILLGIKTIADAMYDRRLPEDGSIPPVAEAYLAPYAVPYL